MDMFKRMNIKTTYMREWPQSWCDLLPPGGVQCVVVEDPEAGGRLHQLGPGLLTPWGWDLERCRPRRFVRWWQRFQWCRRGWQWQGEQWLSWWWYSRWPVDSRGDDDNEIMIILCMAAKRKRIAMLMLWCDVDDEDDIVYMKSIMVLIIITVWVWMRKQWQLCDNNLDKLIVHDVDIIITSTFECELFSNWW